MSDTFLICVSFAYFSMPGKRFFAKVEQKMKTDFMVICFIRVGLYTSKYMYMYMYMRMSLFGLKADKQYLLNLWNFIYIYMGHVDIWSY